MDQFRNANQETDVITMPEVDYLVIGHICRDLTPDGEKIGGTAAYAATVAGTLGCRTAVLSSGTMDYDWAEALPDAQVHQVLSHSTTTFENIYTPTGRIQKVHSIADRLTSEHVPGKWIDTPIVHLGPIADEIDPDIIHLFKNSIVGITPQGWLRAWNGGGQVYAKNNLDATRIFTRSTAVILSEEDLMDETQLENYRNSSDLLVLTQGNRGCTVTVGNETRHVPVDPVRDVEPTGAGDIFAAAFLIRFHRTGGDPWEAARYANEIAAATVSEPDLTSKADRIRKIHSESNGR